MVKIVYRGEYPNPMRIRVLGATFENWKTGEIRDIGEQCATKLLKDAPHKFILTEGKLEEPKKKGLTKSQATDLGEDEQVLLLKNLGLSDKEIKKLEYEEDRVSKILQLQ